MIILETSNNICRLLTDVLNSMSELLIYYIGELMKRGKSVGCVRMHGDISGDLMVDQIEKYNFLLEIL